MAPKPRSANRLTVKKIARLKTGRHIDGGGLSLLVSDIGSKSWTFRYERGGRDRAMVLDTMHGNGGVRPPLDKSRGLTLDEARTEAAKNLALLKAGIDPIDAKRDLKMANVQAAAETAKLKTFEALAIEYSDAHATDWIPEDRPRFLSSLRAYAFGKIGPLLPDAIDVSAVRSVLEPIWLTKNPTADRIRGRIENVLDFATALKLRSGENPARWSVLETVLPKKITSGKHHAALPYADIPAFVASLASYRGAALEFLILTASRSDEVIGARWDEIN
jgi:integrase